VPALCNSIYGYNLLITWHVNLCLPYLIIYKVVLFYDEPDVGPPNCNNQTHPKLSMSQQRPGTAICHQSSKVADTLQVAPIVNHHDPSLFTPTLLIWPTPLHRAIVSPIFLIALWQSEPFVFLKYHYARIQGFCAEPMQPSVCAPSK
jgi:hypothetical protein